MQFNVSNIHNILKLAFTWSDQFQIQFCISRHLKFSNLVQFHATQNETRKRGDLVKFNKKSIEISSPELI